MINQFDNVSFSFGVIAGIIFIELIRLSLELYKYQIRENLEIKKKNEEDKNLFYKIKI